MTRKNEAINPSVLISLPIILNEKTLVNTYHVYIPMKFRKNQWLKYKFFKYLGKNFCCFSSFSSVIIYNRLFFI